MSKGPVKDYIYLRDRLTEEYGNDLSKWKEEHFNICKMRADVKLAFKVTKDKINELTATTNK